MKTMIKKMIFMGLVISNLLALGGMDSLPSDEKNVAKSIQETLAISKNDAFNVYKEYLQFYLNTEQWSLHFFSNTTLTHSKVVKSKNKTMFLTLLKDNRVVNISLIKFSNENQILIYVNETLPRKSAIALERFNELEKEKDYTKDRETSNFAYFSKKGYAKKVNIFVSSPIGTIQYTDLYSYNLKD
jgi:hypothetical protein